MKLKALFLFSYIFLFSFSFADAPRDLFKQHNYNKVFVETGTYHGDGVRMALDAGFDEVYSVEYSNNFFVECEKRFEGNHNVYLYCGDSGSLLYDMIKDINEPITFWLDAHIHDGVKAKKNTPLMEELECIKRHHIHDHTILIDDTFLCGSERFDYITLRQLVRKLREINPRYKIKVLHDWYTKVLIARP